MRKQLAPPAKASQGFFLAALVFAIVITMNIIIGETGGGSVFKARKIDRLEESKSYIFPAILIVAGLVFRVYEKRKTRM